MEHIVDPHPMFDFSKLSLVEPTSVQGGSYFTRLLHQGKPFYFQTPTCLMRNGIQKSGKKFQTELMFDNKANGDLLAWTENLESRCHQLVFEKAGEWFNQGQDGAALKLTEIEGLFQSSLRLYKSGKYSLLRAFSKTNASTQSAVVRIYDENEQLLQINDIQPDNTLVCIIEVVGIRFSTRHFQLEYELKQIMTCKSETEEPVLFSSCVIKKNSNASSEVVPVRETEALDSIKEEEPLLDQVMDDVLEEFIDPDRIDPVRIDPVRIDPVRIDPVRIDPVRIDPNRIDGINGFNGFGGGENIILDIEDLNEDKNTLKEIPFVNETSLETMTLKRPNEVYYEIYKEARRKAKEAKKAAVVAYLEARNIKKTYMLEELDSSDSDEEEESENV